MYIYMYWGLCWVFFAVGVVMHRLLITGTSLVVTWGLKGTGPNTLCMSSEKQCEGDSSGAERFEPES